MARRIKRVWSDLRFMADKSRLLSPPDQPYLDPEALALFESIILSPGVRTYVEYGAGGGTLLAARHVDVVISVESDKHYLNLVKGALDGRDISAAVHLIHGRVGPTARWGYPFFRAGGYAVSGRHYVNAPWRALERVGRDADFVLVDGRYRMACACAALLHPRGEKAVILMDDFANRDHYNDILQFTDLVEQKGRGVLVRRKQDFDAARCRMVLKTHFRDSR